MPNLSQSRKGGVSVDSSDLLAQKKRSIILQVANSKPGGKIKNDSKTSGFGDITSANAQKGLDYYTIPASAASAPSEYFTYTSSAKTIITGYSADGGLNRTSPPPNTPFPTIPSRVTGIAANAFTGCTGFIGNLDLSRTTLTTIGDYAFQSCTGFTGTLTFPSGLTSIGASAFYGSSGFTGGLNLSVATSLTTIGSSAFSNCTGFNGNLIFPNSVTFIGNSTFYGCSGFIGNLTLPASLQTIADYAFSNCSGFNGNLNLSATSLTTFGDYAFSNCTGFTGGLDLSVATGLRTTGANTFRGCTGFTGTLTFPVSITSIGANAFYSCTGFTGGLDLSVLTGLTTIGNSAFRQSTGFNGVLKFPASLTTLGDNAFNTCSKISGDLDLSVATGLTTISDSAFIDCIGFTGTLTFPDSIATIAANAFKGCTGFRLQDVVCYAAYIAGLKLSAFDNTSITPLAVPPFYEPGVLNSVRFLGNKWITVGGDSSTSNIILYTSDNPTTYWISKSSKVQGLAGFLNSIGYDGSTWIVTGTHYTGVLTVPTMLMYTSTDSGDNWTLNSSVSTTQQFIINGIYYAGGDWVLVGNATQTPYHAKIKIPSTRNIPTGAWMDILDVSNASFSSVSYGNGVWMAVGQDYSNGQPLIYTATDPRSTWTRITSTQLMTPTLVGYGNGVWVTNGTSNVTGTLFTSNNNGTTWAKNTLVGYPARNFSSIAFRNNMWVAVGVNSSTLRSYVYTTTNPTGNWNSKTLDTTNYTSITNIDYNGTYWTICGSDTNGNCVIYTTRDPTGNWTKHP